MSIRRLSLVVAAASLVAPAARAHEYWLAPSRYHASAGERVSVTAFVGTGFRGEPRPYAAPRAVRFALATARTVDLTPVAAQGDPTWAAFVLPDSLGGLVAYQSNFATIELPAADFDAYLALEGLDGARAARAKLGASAGPGRERYARCAKTWIAGEPAAPPGAARALAPVGLPLEIVPLADPAAGRTLAVRVLWHGEPLAGALVRAWNTPLGPSWAPRGAAARDSVGPSGEARTDARGEARLTVDGPGEWLLSTVHMVPCAERHQADWESWWASLTFGRGPARP